ncbi:MAG: ABC transporter ATP-binding protein [Mariniblastus sp.]
MIKISEEVPAVRFDAVVKSYGESRVVDELSFEIPSGTTFGLLGPNGAGKSTSLKSLMGLLGLDSGSIEIFGKDIAAIHGTSESLAVRRRIGYVSEVHNVYPWMTIGNAIEFVKSFYPTWNDEIARELLDTFALSPKKKASQLSKGMLAKLSLLLAVSHEPDLLILDEPTSGLDPMVREEFLHGILKSIGEKEKTIIFSSHSIDDVQRIADRVGVLRNGKLIVDHSVDHILGNTKRLRAALTSGDQPCWTPDSTIWQQVNRREWQLTVDEFTPELVAEVQAKNPIESIEVLDLSLEEIFKDYVRCGDKSEVGNA